ncbi:MFS transporter [Planctomycetaceae bacterium]|jgi:MFS family permease|nr:MFS transporter [Planctomycetaceae bacterium]
MSDSKNTASDQKWYSGITQYQWLVLIIASLGWIFDVFEGQIFVASMRDTIPDLLNVEPEHPSVAKWNDWAFAAFAFGGAIGGMIFGVVSDRIGRSKTMIITILFYSLFTLFQAFVQTPEQLMILRFFVAMGVGGEWAVASAMVAEVMPLRVRPITSSIFHASSVFGTLLAAAAGVFIINNPNFGWRYGFAIGVLPALLTLWIRWKMKEPEQWQKARERAAADKTQATGKFSDLFAPVNLRNTLVGVSLASIGLTTFWGCHIYGKNALLSLAQKEAMIAEDVPLSPPSTKDLDKAKADGELTEAEWTDQIIELRKEYFSVRSAAFKKHNVKGDEMLSMVLNTLGGGLGLVLFGWFSNRLGRKGAFMMYHLLGFACAILMFKFLIPNEASAWVLGLFLPIFGFFTLGMHAGYAVYFPELYPTRLRGTGAGFCFNGGRILQGVAFFGIGALALAPGDKASYLAWLYLVGAIVVLFARETRGQELPE